MLCLARTNAVNVHANATAKAFAAFAALQMHNAICYGTVPQGSPEQIPFGQVHVALLAIHCNLKGSGRAGKAGNWQRVLKLASDMQRSSVQPDVWTYASLIAACQSCGNRWQDALAFYQDMQDKGELPCTEAREPRILSVFIPRGFSGNLIATRVSKGVSSPNKWGLLHSLGMAVK